MQWDRLVPGKIRPDPFETKRMKAAAQIRPCTWHTAHSRKLASIEDHQINFVQCLGLVYERVVRGRGLHVSARTLQPWPPKSVVGHV